MPDRSRLQWFNDYKIYWLVYVLLVAGQAWMTVSQTSWPKVKWFTVFFAGYLIIHLVVALLILLLTWPVRRNLEFARYMKILIAFSAVFFLSQLITVVVAYFQG